MELIKRLREKGDETRAFFMSVPVEQWDQQVYQDGPQWVVRQILAHFVSAETAFEEVFEAAMQGRKDAPENFSIDEFNKREVANMGDFSPTELIVEFQHARARTIGFLESIEDDDLARESWHPWFGWDKLEKFLKLVYRHNMLHERDIRKALDTGQPLPSPE
jgi:hypothetical protein